MSVLLEFIDDQYEYIKITHKRLIARAVVVNENGLVALMHLNRNDEFGNYDYYETPGGGVNEGEDISVAVLREIKEETGCNCKVIAKLGVISDYYNKIYRHNLNHYYLLKVNSYGEKQLEEYEKDIFTEIVWLPISEAINYLENMEDKMIPLLVKRRELPIFKLAKEIIEKEKNHNVVLKGR